MNDKNLNVRISSKTLELLKEKAKANDISQSKLVTIAVELITPDDILAYALGKLEKKHKSDMVK